MNANRLPLRAALAALVALASLTAPRAASAQSGADDDAPIPYSDDGDAPKADDGGMRELPRDSDESHELREETEVEQDDREIRLAGNDDPNKGLGGSLLAGVLLIDSARAQFAEPRFAWGLRFTWEWGRLIPDDPWHDALFADVSWTYGALHDGTTRIFTDTNYHYFSVAPAYELGFGPGKSYGVYAQLGGGLAYQLEGVTADGAVTTIAGIKPLFQYGVGFRGRPVLLEDPLVRLTFRVELTRFRRGYMDDTFIAGSIGANF